MDGGAIQDPGFKIHEGEQWAPQGPPAPGPGGLGGGLALTGEARGADDLLSTRGVGERIGLTEQTVRNWHKAGMREDARDFRGRPQWRMATVERWRAAHRPPTQKGRAIGGGGRRPGRKPRSANPTALPPAGGEAAGTGLAPGMTPPLAETHARAAAEAGARKAAVDTAKRLWRMGRESDADRALIDTLTEAEAVTPADAEVRLKAIKADEARVSMERERGELLSGEEVAERWAAFLGMLLGRVEALPTRLANLVGAALTLDGARVRAAREAMERGLEDVRREVVAEAAKLAAPAAAVARAA